MSECPESLSVYLCVKDILVVSSFRPRRCEIHVSMSPTQSQMSTWPWTVKSSCTEQGIFWVWKETNSNLETQQPLQYLRTNTKVPFSKKKDLEVGQILLESFSCTSPSWPLEGHGNEVIFLVSENPGTNKRQKSLLLYSEKFKFQGLHLRRLNYLLILMNSPIPSIFPCPTNLCQNHFGH